MEGRQAGALLGPQELHFPQWGLASTLYSPVMGSVQYQVEDWLMGQLHIIMLMYYSGEENTY